MSRELQQMLPVLAQLAQPGATRASLQDVARWDGRSTFHVQRSFRQATGETPLQFQKRVSLQRAAAALASTERSVLEIALDAGFETHEGFTRAFKARFGESPRSYRKRAHGTRDSLDLAYRSAPCIGLYRAPLDPIHNHTSGEETMSYEIETRTLEATPFLFVRRKIEPEKISEALGEMFGAVYQHVLAQGLEFAGPPTARYPGFGPGLITIEAGMPIAAAAEGTDEIEAGTLGGGVVATTIHKGPYDRLSEGHQAVEKWLSSEGRDVTGPPWEVYVTDPGEVPNPEEWLTEINWPLEA